jgi:epoxyqueuosine reductase
MQKFIKESALSLGFSACGIAKAEPLIEDAVFLSKWIAEGNHGEMQYLNRNFDKRTDPRLLVPGCKSIVVVLFNYFTDKNQPADAPQIARYAHSQTDYHIVIKSKIKALEDKLVAAYGNEIINPDVQHSFVDSAPVLERRWAERAGLGWIGKHTQLIAPQLGSYFFIGVLMLNVEMEYDRPIADRCGTCTRCIDACPTVALIPHRLDARRCISYQTIEKKTAVDEDIQPLLSNYAFGCDICADVCPWNNKWAIPHKSEELKAIDIFQNWNKSDWNNLDENQFKQVFKNSSIKRAGYAKLKDNIAFLSENNGFG